MSYFVSENIGKLKYRKVKKGNEAITNDINIFSLFFLGEHGERFFFMVTILYKDLTLVY